MIFQNNILIIIIANFIFSSNLAYELNYVDSLYKIGDYNNSAKIIKNLYNQDNDNVEIIFRLARSIFLIAEEEKNQPEFAQKLASLADVSDFKISQLLEQMFFVFGLVLLSIQ